MKTEKAQAVATAQKPRRAATCPPKSTRYERIDWPGVPERTYDIDVLRCFTCGGTMRGIALIEDREVVRTRIA